MITTQRNKERRQRRLFAAIAGWALLGAASTGIVACSNADAAETANTAAVAPAGTSAATSPASSSAASSSVTTSSAAAAAAPTSAAAPSAASAAPPSSASAAAPTTEAATTAAAAPASTYADGSYTATGSYSSPGGQESITVTLTLAGDVITGATAEGDATRPPSSQYQEQFSTNFASLIVGKDIDDVSLDKVAGSSLTSGGFNAAVESIKSDALA